MYCCKLLHQAGTRGIETGTGARDRDREVQPDMGDSVFERKGYDFGVTGVGVVGGAGGTGGLGVKLRWWS